MSAGKEKRAVSESDNDDDDRNNDQSEIRRYSRWRTITLIASLIVLLVIRILIPNIELDVILFVAFGAVFTAGLYYYRSRQTKKNSGFNPKREEDSAQP